MFRLWESTDNSAYVYFNQFTTKFESQDSEGNTPNKEYLFREAKVIVLTVSNGWLEKMWKNGAP